MQVEISSSSLSRSPAASTAIEMADEVVARACRRSATCPGGTLRRRASPSTAACSTARVAAELVHRDHAMRPVQQHRRVGGVDAQELGDQDDRNRRREGVDQVDPPLAIEAVDELVRQGRDARPQPLDLARHEGPVDQPAQPRVRRRLALQQRECARWRRKPPAEDPAPASRAPRASRRAGSPARSAGRADSAAPLGWVGRRTRSRNPPSGRRPAARTGWRHRLDRDPGRRHVGP